MRKNQKNKFDTVKLDNVRMEKKNNSSIIFIIYLFILLMLSLFIYLSVFQLNNAESLRLDSRNPRLQAKEKDVILGTIYAADRTKLAVTKEVDGKLIREYPEGEKFAHVVGYTGSGRFGLEDTLYNELLKTPEDNRSFITKLRQSDTKEKKEGNSVITTISPILQKISYDGIGNRKGAVVLMEPSTGKVLAMVSKPSFNPNTIKEDWDKIVNDTEQAPLLNRATQGLYPPGSTFKILTALEYMRENEDYSNFSYKCSGTINRHNLPVSCAFDISHGSVNLESAFEKSCNGAFVEMGLTLDIDKYRDLVESFGFNGEIPTDNFRFSESRFDLNKNSSYGEIMHTSFGQGNTLVTPIQNCLIASTIANGGIMMKTQFIDHIEDSSHRIVHRNVPIEYKTVLKPVENQIITDMMEGVVKRGTARYLDGAGYSVACKTGTAQYNNNKNNHNILIGFAPVENPKIAFSIILEGYENQPQKDNQIMKLTKNILDTYLGE